MRLQSPDPDPRLDGHLDVLLRYDVPGVRVGADDPGRVVYEDDVHLVAVSYEIGPREATPTPARLSRRGAVDARR